MRQPHRKPFIWLKVGVICKGGGCICKSSGPVQDPEKEKENDTEVRDNVYMYFFKIFVYILYLVIVIEILWRLTHYVLDDPQSIANLPFWDFLEKIQISYIAGFDAYEKTLYAMLFSVCVSVLYLIIDFISNIVEKGKLKFELNLKNLRLAFIEIYDLKTFKITLISLFFLIVYFSGLLEYKSKDIIPIFLGVVFVFFYSYVLLKYIKYKMSSCIEKDIYNICGDIFYPILYFSFIYPIFLWRLFSSRLFDMEESLIFILKGILLTLILFILGYYIISEFLEEIKSKNSQKNEDKESKSRWSIALPSYIIFLYFAFCLFFAKMQETNAGPLSGVFTLLGVAFLISGGFYFCGFMADKLIAKNKRILELLNFSYGEKDGEKGTKKKGTEGISFLNKVRSHIRPLLFHFFIAISSFIFIRALFIIMFDSSPSYLSIILVIPLYIFLLRTGLIILKKIYEKIYTKIEKKTHMFDEYDRKEPFVKVLLSLTKAAFLFLIFVDIINRLVGNGFFSSMSSNGTIGDLIKLAIAIPIAVWILVLILDPFFENETIEVEGNVGKIKHIGFFFTTMETMMGEQVYVPNAELIAKKIKRLYAREDKKENKQGEKGVMIHFSCTLNYDYKPDDVKDVFMKLFNNKNKNELIKFIEDVKCESKEDKNKEDKNKEDKNKEDKKLNYIFNKEKSFPFVFLEDFKDHGIVYRFNFRVKDALYAPVIKGYFMKKFKEQMKDADLDIYTPVKFEITDFMSDKYKRNKYRKINEEKKSSDKKT